MSDSEQWPPLVYNIICGRKLEALRLRARLTQQDVAKQMDVSQSKVTTIESAGSSVDPRYLDALLDLYEADTASREECRRLAKLGKPRRIRGLLRSHFTGGMQDVIDMEGSANTIWVHNSMLVHGLLQTESYMRYVFRAYRPSLTAEQIDQATADRLARQAVLDNPNQHFWFLVDEAALCRMNSMDGGSEIMREQIERLMKAVDLPNIEVQVVPFDHGYYVGEQEDYWIFGYDADLPVYAASVEQYDGVSTVRDTRKIGRFLNLWDHQKAAALGPEQTRSFLRRMARSL
ncbi:MAG TPA: helix-turn-helix transcriptional regulator [Pseudonocardiaceae bacterium]|nr:helix-turn-helix transcriptional regulator [Pseudonocardiaceae bacterium]